MLAKRLKARVGKDGTLVLHVPDVPQGEVEIIILQEDERIVSSDEMIKQIPKHRVGKISTSLRREDIYNDAR